jgi:hypothetical protein
LQKLACSLLEERILDGAVAASLFIKRKELDDSEAGTTSRE